MLARRFLYIIAAVIIVILAAGVSWTLFQARLLRMTFVPDAPYSAPRDDTAPDYGKATAWLSRPGMADDPSLWLPQGHALPAQRPAAIFFVPPTTYLSADRWNAPFDSAEALPRWRLFANIEGSAFNSVGEIWAPLYRQAAIGAFIEPGADAAKALDFAYGDVEKAFDQFLAEIGPDRPILLAGHSQGAYHLIRLLQQRVDEPLRKRIVAAYLVGWPISMAHDLPALGLPACQARDEAGCILSWLTFASPADPHQMRDIYTASIGLDGKPRGETAMLCTNPLTGTPGTVAVPESANLGALVPGSGQAMQAELEPGKVPAGCTEEGLLLIGQPPKGYGAFVLPGNNYHVFDYALFWANVRADAERRTAEYLRK